MDDAAEVLERGGMTDEAAQFREQARQWRRAAWPLHDRTEPAPLRQEDTP